MDLVLNVERLSKIFGGLVALNSFSLSLPKKAIHCLIGPNGAGKTVAINCITGFYKPDGGRVYFNGVDVTGLKSSAVAARGLVRSFQITRLFPQLTLLQSVTLANQQKNAGKNFLSSCASLLGHSSPIDNLVYDIIERLNLTKYKGEFIANLPHGTRRLVEFANLLVMRPEPSCILLDEPMVGLNSSEIENLSTLISDLRDEGKSFLIVEHNTRFVLNISDNIVVLDRGEKIAEGSPEHIRSDASVAEVYFGKSPNSLGA